MSFAEPNATRKTNIETAQMFTGLKLYIIELLPSCEGGFTFQVVHDEDVGNEADHILLSAAGWDPKKMIEITDGGTQHITCNCSKIKNQES